MSGRINRSKVLFILVASSLGACFLCPPAGGEPTAADERPPANGQETDVLFRGNIIEAIALACGPLHIYTDAAFLLPHYKDPLDRQIIETEYALNHWPPKDLPQQDLAAYQHFLQDAYAALDLVKQGLQEEKRPGWPGPQQWHRAELSRYPASVQLRRIGRVLVAKGGTEYRQGNWSEALGSYLDVLEFATDMVRGGLLADLFISNAVSRNAPPPILALVRDHALSADDLRGALQRLRRINSEQEPFAGFVLREFSEWKFVNRNPEKSAYWRSILNSPRSRWHYRHYWEDVLAAAELPYPQWVASDIGQHWRALERHAQQELLMTPTLWRKAREISDNFQASMRAATIVAALELYHIERGEYPQRLRDLAPSYLAEVPVDPFSGASLVCSRKASGWSMYSVGPNARDDGGAGDDIVLNEPGGKG